MPAPLALALRPEQVTELAWVRDHDPTPYMREKAAAILKVAAGQSLRAVARSGLLRRHRHETIAAWVHRYQDAGLAGLRVRPGRVANRPFFPLVAAAARHAAGGGASRAAPVWPGP
jgi:hypothetical protein